LAASLLAICNAGFAQTPAEIDSHIARRKGRSRVSVLLSNHSEYDGAYTKTRLAGRKREVGEENPFIVGTDGVQRYFTVMTECAQASKVRFGANSAAVNELHSRMGTSSKREYDALYRRTELLHADVTRAQGELNSHVVEHRC
jgi:hypothetical protein